MKSLSVGIDVLQVRNVSQQASDLLVLGHKLQYFLVHFLNQAVRSLEAQHSSFKDESDKMASLSLIHVRGGDENGRSSLVQLEEQLPELSS